MHLHSTAACSVSRCCRVNCSSNMWWDSYGGSSPTYTDCSVINAPAPEGSTVRRSTPATALVQGWGYPATASWYYLGYSASGQDPRPEQTGCVTQQSADPADLQPWW